MKVKKMENFPEQNKLNRLQWSSFNVTNPLMQWTLEEFPAACTFHPSKKFSTQARRPLRWNSFSWQVEWTLHCTQLHSLVSSPAQWVHDRGIQSLSVTVTPITLTNRLQWQFWQFPNYAFVHKKPSAYCDTSLTGTLSLCPDTVTVNNRLCSSMVARWLWPNF